MRKPCLWALASASVFFGFNSVAQFADAVVEDFTTDPLSRGWQMFGDTNLFHWQRAKGNLEVTWDSSRSNSYFQLPLGTILTRQDDFRVELDLLLNDFAAGVNPEKPFTFQLAFGFQNRGDAEKASFNRGTGKDSPNLVEFNFFPDTGWGPTVWPGVYSTNSGMNYNGPGDFSLFDLPTGVTMRVSLAYSASHQIVTTFIMTNGMLAGPVTSARLATNSTALSSPFTNFRLDTLALASYSDLGLSPSSNSGSILAHGVVDNLVVSSPPRPAQELRGAFAGNQWQAEFLSRTNWKYVLEATTNFHAWTQVGLPQSGTGGKVRLQDTNTATVNARFYRIKALRPD